MQERTLDNLILENEDYIFAGDLIINGKVSINNGSLIVSGTLILEDDLIIVDGNLSCGSIEAQDVYVSGDIYISGISDLCNITADGFIEIGEYNSSKNIDCLTLFIGGDNSSECINCKQDIYILGDNDSYAINANDVLITGDCSLCFESLIAKSFTCKGTLTECDYISIG